MDTFAAIADERRQLADVLAGLTDAQWATPSLCAGWTVRHVAAHLVTPFLVRPVQLIGPILRHRGLPGAMDALARRIAERPTTELVDVLRANADSRFTPPGRPAEAPLTDILVHGTDIRLPLGLPLDRDQDRVVASLRFVVASTANRVFVPKGRLTGLSFAATDHEWTFGEGPLVSGPVLRLALAILGRPAGLDGLTGDGVDELRRRIS